MNRLRISLLAVMIVLLPLAINYCHKPVAFAYESVFDVGARVYNSQNILITKNIYNTLTFDSERYDTDGIHSNIVNNSRLTCPIKGRYVIAAHIAWDGNSVGRRHMTIKLNGITFLATVEWAASDTYVKGQSISTVYDLVAGDYVEVLVYQNSGLDLNIKAEGSYSPEFMMQRIGIKGGETVNITINQPFPPITVNPVDVVMDFPFAFYAFVFGLALLLVAFFIKSPFLSLGVFFAMIVVLAEPKFQLTWFQYASAAILGWSILATIKRFRDWREE